MSVYSLLILLVLSAGLLGFVLAAPSWTRRLRAPRNLTTLIDPNRKKCCGKGYLGTYMTKGPDGKYVSTGRQEICGCVGRNYDKYQKKTPPGLRERLLRLFGPPKDTIKTRGVNG